MKIKFIVGRVKWQHKPIAQEVVACQSVEHYRCVDATIQQIYDLITSGRCWRAGILADGAKDLKRSSFIGSQILALDFDEFAKKPEELIEYCKALDILPNFWYYSFSQGKKALYNYRVVWVFDSILSVQEYEDLYKRVLADEVLGNADKATKDLSRLWFGTVNGGEFIKDKAAELAQFSIFTSKDVDKYRNTKASGKSVEYAQSEVQTQFKMASDFDWRGALAGVCDLWDKWASKVYLHYAQRLLLFSELKMIRYSGDYDSINKEKLVDEIMEYYDPELYKGSKCDRKEVLYFLSDKTSNNVANKIVRYENEEYTISEYFNKGIYHKRIDVKKKKERITREELQNLADAVIPEALAQKGINYIECQTEAGKTERILRFLSEQDLSAQKIIYAMPTYVLIQEVEKRAEKLGIKDIFCPHRVEYTDADLLYLDAGFPEGVSITQEMIARKKELHSVKDPDKKGLFFLTHACLAHMTDVSADLIIIDENIEDCLIDRNRIYLEAIYAMKAFLPTVLIDSGEDIGGKSELDKLIKRIECGDVGDIIDNIDMAIIFKHLMYKEFIGSELFKNCERGQGIRGIGKLRDADILKIGKDEKERKYLYFERPSKLLRNCYDKHIPVKLFTGTPKIEQLKAGLIRDDELIRAIGEPIRLKRADPRGEIVRYYEEGATGSKRNIDKTFMFAIKKLEELNVDWQNTNLLTLKSAVSRARMYGFKIAQTDKGDDLYIENCAGYDGLKGQDLIVIGKPDIPPNCYLDMVNVDVPIRKRSIVRTVEDTGIEQKIYGYTDTYLWSLQAEQIREPIEQAVGRARALWYECKVYVFCDYPLRAEKDKIEPDDIDKEEAE